MYAIQDLFAFVFVCSTTSSRNQIAYNFFWTWVNTGNNCLWPIKFLPRKGIDFPTKFGCRCIKLVKTKPTNFVDWHDFAMSRPVFERFTPLKMLGETVAASRSQLRSSFCCCAQWNFSTKWTKNLLLKIVLRKILMSILGFIWMRLNR